MLPDIEAEVVEAKLKEHSSIEDVNTHLLDKLDELIESVDPKSDPEMVKVLTESVAKLNTSIRGNNIFTPQESDEERREREQREILGEVIGG